MIGISPGVVAFLRRAEDLLHFRVVIEKREKYGNSLDDGSAQLRLNSLPVVPEPALDRIELCDFVGITFTLYPIIRPGSLVQIDSSERKISPAPWKTDFDRPIYFTELRDGYVCSWCEIARGRLMVIPHSHAHREVRIFDHPAEAEIVGRVTGVAMRIVGDRSPEPRAPSREK